MSFRSEKILFLVGEDFQQKSAEDLKKMFLALLEDAVHGLCFSAYTEGQEPGMTITAEQITERINIIKPYTKWVRTFSCTDGNELIPKIARQNGLKTMVGAWLNDDKEKMKRKLKTLSG